MGILSWLTPSPALISPRRPARLAAPWSESGLQGVVASDFLGLQNQPVTRALAMRQPAVAKARALIVGPLSRQPLTVLEGSTPIPEQPGWTQRTTGPVSPQMRMAWTLDDQFFYGVSCWAVNRLGDELLDAQRIPYELWQLNEKGKVEVALPGEDYKTVSDEEVIVLWGPQEGLLDIASGTIKGSAALETAWIERAKTPIPVVEFHNTSDDDLEDDEIEGILDGYVEARRADDTQTVVYTPRQVEMRTHGDVQVNLFIEGRNALRLDLAAFASLPGSLLDASLSTATLTYSTKEGARNELVDYSLGYWADPIAGRLSQDDVVPFGQSVRFDLTEFQAPSTVYPNTSRD